ncbi:protein SSUH2 homolog [Hemicordylus capensis]|uniref:protein SSUH2 homolog n=1 Tax=Hemicordylus capensis TaxID=884348 RepID=UPI002302ACD3|nr:protein SSUH2 homolog [Hemicordylus capensis]
METELLIGDKSSTIASYESEDPFPPSIAQVNKSFPDPSYQLLNEELNPHKKNWNILSVSEQEVKEAFLQYASSKCCYRTAPAEKMVVRNLTPLNTYRYRLETFTEKREANLASELYYGGFVDSSAVGLPPAPWDIVVDPPPLFTDCEMHIPVPHTYFVQNCPDCKGQRGIKCQSCNGTGKKKCSSCNGTGSTWQEDSHVCSFCAGTGDKSCLKCHSSGWLKCVRCNESGLLLFHTELTITWKNNVAEHVAGKNSDFPTHHFQEVTGRKIHHDEQPMVYPITDFPEPSINASSRACIAQHKMKFVPGGLHRILRQKQTVELVPLTKVEYEWQGSLYSFYLFGNEKKVYAEDYPEKCCCSVM